MKMFTSILLMFAASLFIVGCGGADGNHENEAPVNVGNGENGDEDVTSDAGVSTDESTMGAGAGEEG